MYLFIKRFLGSCSVVGILYLCISFIEYKRKILKINGRCGGEREFILECYDNVLYIFFDKILRFVGGNNN